MTISWHQQIIYQELVHTPHMQCNTQCPLLFVLTCVYTNVVTKAQPEFILAFKPETFSHNFVRQNLE